VDAPVTVMHLPLKPLNLMLMAPVAPGASAAAFVEKRSGSVPRVIAGTVQAATESAERTTRT
jgi:hypothetical protein